MPLFGLFGPPDIETLKAKRDVEKLVKVLVSPKISEDWRRARRAAATALGELGDARAVQPLIEALKDGDNSIATIAAKALGEIGSGEAVEPLIFALKDKRHTVRAQAATALGHLRDVRAVEPLIMALQDKEHQVRCEAA